MALAESHSLAVVLVNQVTTKVSFREGGREGGREGKGGREEVVCTGGGTERRWGAGGTPSP